MLKQSPDTDMQAFSVDHVGMLEGLDTMKTIFLEVFLVFCHAMEIALVPVT